MKELSLEEIIEQGLEPITETNESEMLLQIAVQQELMRLPLKERLALKLLARGYSLHKIARILGANRAEVKAMIDRAAAHIRQNLADNAGGEHDGRNDD